MKTTAEITAEQQKNRLFIAVKNGNIDIVKKMIASEIDLNFTNNYHETPLMPPHKPAKINSQCAG